MKGEASEACTKTGIYGRFVEPASRIPGGPWIFDERIVLILRLILAFVFIYAAFGKIARPLMFAEQIRMYGILDVSPLLYITAVVLPWIELFCGISLLIGVFIRGSALILAVLNLIFVAVLVYRTAGVVNTENINFFKVFFDCGCGFEPTHAWKKILEDIGLLAISLILFFAPAYGFMIFRSDK